MPVYEVPASRASEKQNQFQFRVPGDKRSRSLPLLKYVPVAYRTRMTALAEPIQAATKAGKQPETADLAAFGRFQIELLERYSPGVTELMDDEQLALLLKAWTEASGISVGESPASAGS